MLLVMSTHKISSIIDTPTTINNLISLIFPTLTYTLVDKPKTTETATFTKINKYLKKLKMKIEE